MADQSGIALPLALLGLVAVSLLVTAVLVSSSTEVAISSAHQDATRDFYRVESAIEGYVAQNASAFAPVTSVDYQTDANAAPVRIGVSQLARTVTQTTNVTIIKRTFSIHGQPLTAGQPQGRTLVAMVNDSVLVPNFTTNIQGAATITSKEVRIGGSSFVSGKTDTRLCAGDSAKADTVAAVTLAKDSQNVNISERNIDGGLSQVVKDTLRSRAELAAYVLNGLTPYEMAQYATIAFKSPGAGQPAWPGGKPNSSLPPSDKLNWGCPLKLYQVFDPGSACAADGDETHYPVVAVHGNIAVQGDHGQGILIVLGDLDITGKFFYSGIVVVTGKTFIRGSGGDSRIDGALVSLGDVSLCSTETSGTTCSTDSGGGDTGEGTEFLGNAKIMYNACMVSAAEQAFAAAVAGSPPPAAVTGRTFAWYEVVR